MWKADMRCAFCVAYMLRVRNTNKCADFMVVMGTHHRAAAFTEENSEHHTKRKQRE